MALKSQALYILSISADTDLPVNPTRREHIEASGVGIMDSENQRLQEEIRLLRNAHLQRETTLMVKLSRKEEEVQTLLAEVNNLSAALNDDGSESLRKKLLDPSLSLLYKAMRKELGEKDSKVKELQAELLAVQFSPNSVVGKRLVAKLKALQMENEELGRLLFSSNRVEQLQTELGLQKKLMEELKSSVEEADQIIVDLDNEIESLQGTLFNQQAQITWYERRYGKRETLVADAEVQVSVDHWPDTSRGAESGTRLDYRESDVDRMEGDGADLEQQGDDILHHKHSEQYENFLDHQGENFEITRGRTMTEEEKGGGDEGGSNGHDDGMDIDSARRALGQPLPWLESQKGDTDEETSPRTTEKQNGGDLTS
ncbi:hypothetical protein HDU93_007279 [Gonapodya sp. JEL0774]|nr:hypothetical protein HDU93_007279 [Gonapodya sp. JEL0774]